MGNNNVKLSSQIDLVTAAQYQYDFLRIVDEHKALYQDAVTCNAIYRYERYWLPLAAERQRKNFTSTVRYRMGLALPSFESSSVPARL